MDLKVGDEVTVVVSVNVLVLVPTKVCRFSTNNYGLIVEFERGAGAYVANEGISWCRGHSGPDVDALKVALALS
jgi:hypothetical protein